jgi:hypothetical protein
VLRCSKATPRPILPPWESLEEAIEAVGVVGEEVDVDKNVEDSWVELAVAKAVLVVPRTLNV